MNRLIIVLLILFCRSVNGQEKKYDFVFPEKIEGQAPMLSLRFLNEETAGANGFIRLSEDGESFMAGDQPIRFWPVNSGGGDMNDEELANHAAFLAQMGVNMVRYHGSINPSGKGTDRYDVDRKEIDNIWRVVAAMKKQGIYTTISPFWPHNGHMGGWLPKEWGIEGYSDKDDLWGVMYFNDRLQDAYKAWVKVLYTEKNPYTGVALKEEPAVGIIQIMNEDGVFFWTMQNMKPSLKKMVQAKFNTWLMKKYGTLSNAFAAWGKASLPGDQLKEQVVDLYTIYDMTLEASGDKAIRLRDQVEFYADTQYDFYKNIHNYYRDVLGCKQIINAENWTTASPARLHDLERWTNTSNEVLAINRYYDPGHFGENAGWRIDPGHHYMGLSALKNPQKLPINVKQVAGHPFIMTESGWNLPHKYAAEGPFLISTIQSITGFDAYYWFAAEGVDYTRNPYFDFTKDAQGRRAMNRWTCSLPGVIGQFPANALLYRLGYLKSGEVVVHEEKPMDKLWNREVSAIVEETNFDPNRDAKNNLGAGNDSEISPLAFLTGKVEVVYGGDASSTRISPELKQWVDTENKLIKSSSGEMEWDYSKGICLVNTEKAKGVCGFMNGGKFNLGKVHIASNNNYAAVWVVAMDNQPIESSAKVLIQVGTIYQPSGWKEEEADFKADNQNLHGFKVLDTGSMPW
ncbi:MAG TPA: hypothetical protein VFG54_11250, partial [Prolixibacteraceae bacterium]|nr:hypothetical protein [Prolixibacteraceae bacterium]